MPCRHGSSRTEGALSLLKFATLGLDSRFSALKKCSKKDFFVWKRLNENEHFKNRDWSMLNFRQLTFHGFGGELENWIFMRFLGFVTMKKVGKSTSCRLFRLKTARPWDNLGHCGWNMVILRQFTFFKRGGGPRDWFLDHFSGWCFFTLFCQNLQCSTGSSPSRWS